MLLSNLIILGLATATVSTTVGSSKLFRGLRSWVATQSPFWGELISCPYCLGHWVALFAVLLYNPPATALAVDLIIQWLAVTALSAVTSGLIGRLHGD